MKSFNEWMEENSSLKLYHGTTKKLQIGESLLPPSVTGSDFYSHPDIDPAEFHNYNYVYLTSNLENAKHFGMNKALKGQNVYVYEVEPKKDLEEDPESEFTGYIGNYRCSEATVKKIVDIIKR